MRYGFALAWYWDPALPQRRVPQGRLQSFLCQYLRILLLDLNASEKNKGNLQKKGEIGHWSSKLTSLAPRVSGGLAATKPLCIFSG